VTVFIDLGYKPTQCPDMHVTSSSGSLHDDPEEEELITREILTRGLRVED
jgi:hypothetical protein